MDDEELEEWELDDWEGEAFDEDVHDHSELEGVSEGLVGVEEAFVDAPSGEDSAVLLGGGLAATPDASERGHHGGSRMGWSAWEVGTVFALGGWLADRHAHETGGQVAAALTELRLQAPPEHPRRGRPPPTSTVYKDEGGRLELEGELDPSSLYSELLGAAALSRDLMVQARGPVGIGRDLRLVISALPSPEGLRFWVIAEATPDGFSTSRLLPVFEAEPQGRYAIFTTDHASETVDAATWACGREGLDLVEFRVTAMQPPSTPRAAGGSPRPAPQLIRSPQDAEVAVRDWMRAWGFLDASLTGSGSDGGVDVVSNSAVAQVKAEALPIGRPVVQAIYGIATAEGKQALVFALAGFTNQALEWADRAGVACFAFDLQGEPQALNPTARLLASGNLSDATSEAVLGAGDAVDPKLLPVTLHDTLVVRGHGDSQGVVHSAWTAPDWPTVWRVELVEGSRASVAFYPIVLDKQWLRRKHPRLAPGWHRMDHSGYFEELLRRDGTWTPDWKERLAQGLEEREGDAAASITYFLERDEGSIELTLRQVTAELEAAMRAFGARLTETRFEPGMTPRESTRKFAAALKEAKLRQEGSADL